MKTKTGSLSLTLIFILVAASVVGALALWNVSYSSASSSAAADKPLNDLAPILKTDISIFKRTSADPDIQMQARLDGFELSLLAENRGSGSARPDVDYWELRLTGPAWYLAPERIAGDAADIAPGSSATIKHMDLGDYVDEFELVPGIYTTELAGFKWREVQFENYTEQTYIKDYELIANIDVSYDVELISATPDNKLLKAEGMAIDIRGDGDRYRIGNASPKQAYFYIANDREVPISGEVSYAQFNIWHNDHRFPDMGTTTVADPHENRCAVLQPGERKLVDALDFSKSNWPIGGDGIADKLGQVAPGLYIAHYRVVTADCTTADGERVLGASHTLIVALEVEP